MYSNLSQPKAFEPNESVLSMSCSPAHVILKDALEQSPGQFANKAFLPLRRAHKDPGRDGAFRTVEDIFARSSELFDKKVMHTSVSIKVEASLAV